MMRRAPTLGAKTEHDLRRSRHSEGTNSVSVVSFKKGNNFRHFVVDVVTRV